MSVSKKTDPNIFSLAFIPRFTNHVFSAVLGCMILYHLGFQVIWYILLITEALVFPLFIGYKASRTLRPKRLEMIALSIDALCAGFWVALTGFSPWYATFLLATTSVGNMSFGGLKRFLSV